MIRTQVYLQDDQYQRIVSLARTGGLPMAEVIRMSISRGLAMKKKNNLFSLSKLRLRGGPKNLSNRLDDYLYK